MAQVDVTAVFAYYFALLVMLFYYCYLFENPRVVRVKMELMSLPGVGW